MNRCENCHDPLVCSCVGLPVPSRLVDTVDLMRDEFLRIMACDGVTDEIRGICERAGSSIEQTVPVLIQRDNAVREMEAWHQCWDDFTKKVGEVMPELKRAPLFTQAEAIVRLKSDLDRALDVLREICIENGMKWPL